MKKIHTVTGPKGSGKSTAVAYFLPPSRIHRAIIVDTEDSMSDILEDLEKNGKHFGHYVRMYDRLTKLQRTSVLNAIAKGDLPWVDTGVKQSFLVQYWEYFIETLASILKDNKTKADQSYVYLGIDTIEPIEAAMTAWVETHRKESGWSGSFTYGRRETEGVRPLYEGFLEACYADGVQDFCLSSHLKPVWEQLGPNEVRRVPNKVQTGGRIVVLSRLSSQMWWLIPGVGNADGAPAALRIKARKGLTTIDADADSWVHRTVLPRRIPHFTWEDVRLYEQRPANLVNPPADEIPTQSELDMISEFLNEEQMRLMVLGAEAALEATKQAVEIQPTASFSIPNPEVERWRQEAENLAQEGLSPDDIREALLSRFPPPLRSSGRADEIITAALSSLEDGDV